jgi:hypothetical protein
LAERADEKSLAESWDAFKQDMSVGKERNQNLINDFTLTNKHAANLLPESISNDAKIFARLANGCNGI